MSENELRKWVSLENCPTALQPFIQVNTCHMLRINQVGRLYTSWMVSALWRMHMQMDAY